MADGQGLIGLLAGGDPLAPEEVGGGISAGLAADPSRLAYSSGPVGQALGQISGGFYQAQAVNAARQVAQAHQEALPYLAKWYSTDDPVKAAAGDPDAPAWAKYTMFNQSPGDIASAKLRLAQTAEATAQAGWLRGRTGGAADLYGPGGGAPAPGATAPGGGKPGVPGNAPQLPEFERWSPQPGTSAAGAAAAGSDDALLNSYLGAPAGADRDKVYGSMSGPQQFSLRQRLRTLQLQRQQTKGQPVAATG